MSFIIGAIRAGVLVSIIKVAGGSCENREWSYPGSPPFTPERLDRIFEPFHATYSEGLGMGHTISRRIVESQEGTLSARNDEGGGMFTLCLPSRSLEESPRIDL
jgi:phosphoglycerate-specific signal transduction histidine kinase